MKKTSLLLALSVIAAGSMTAIHLAPAGAAAEPYTWEECDEGWTIVSNSPAGTKPTSPQGPWHRSSPGNAGSTMAFYHGPPYSSNDSEELLTSPVHTWPGGEATVTYFVNYNYEPYPDSAVVEEGIHIEWSSNGNLWTDVAWHGGQQAGYPAFEAHEVKFNAPAGNLQIRFRAISDALVALSGGAVDDVTIPSPKPAAASCTGGGGGGGGGGGTRTITLQSNKKSAPKGTRITLSGKVTGAGCSASKPVKLKSKPANTSRKYQAAGSTKTKSTGAYKFSTVLKRSTTYQAVAPKSGACAAAKSKAVTVKAT